MIRKPPLHLMRRLKAQGVNGFLQYTHPNPLVRWVFWKRLEKAVQMAPKGGTVLEFGPGSGVLLPTLKALFSRVYAVDVDMAHAALFMGEIGETIEDMREIKGTDTGHPKGMFDAVFAIDALEHNRNVEDIMLEIRRIVKKGGTFIVCGPTENILYRIGRKFYGDSMDMSSEENSHFCTIDDIQRIIQKHFSIEKTATIPFGLPESISFFKIIKARNA